jgi:hypothetical protein
LKLFSGALIFRAVRRITSQQRQQRPPKKKKQAAATLRSPTAGSQDESRCGAIHKLKGNFKSGRSKQRPYQIKGKFNGEQIQKKRRPPKGGRYKGKTAGGAELV